MKVDQRNRNLCVGVERVGFFSGSGRAQAVYFGLKILLFVVVAKTFPFP
jgi:hypothetical protein